MITKIGDSAVDNQGMVKIGSNLRLRFPYRVQQLAKNGKVPMTVVRGGKTMEILVPVGSGRKLLIPDLNGGYPSYFIYGPVVFTRATAEFLSFIAGNPSALNAQSYIASPLVTKRGDPPTPEREELVVVSSPFFPHKLVSGYSSRFGSVIHSVNRVPVRSLAHLVTLLRDLKDEMIVLHFDQRGGETVVVRRQDMVDSTEGILSDNGIRSQGTKDMMEIWSKK